MLITLEKIVSLWWVAVLLYCLIIMIYSLFLTENLFVIVVISIRNECSGFSEVATYSIIKLRGNYLSKIKSYKNSLASWSIYSRK